MPDVYRSAASVLVLRPVADGQGYQLLLLHKPRKKDAWQLPQGGVEQGEDTVRAALRELKEEASLSDCTVIGRSESVYQYDFPPAFRRFRPDNVCGQRIEYVFAMAKADAPVTVDGKEVDGFVWIDVSELEKYIKRFEYLELVGKLYEEAQMKIQDTRYKIQTGRS